MTSRKPLTFLFWNLHGKDLTADVISAVREHQADVIGLAEYSAVPLTALLRDLNVGVAPEFHIPASQSERICLITRFDRQQTHLATAGHTQTAGRGSRKWSIHRLRLPGRQGILLVIVHFIILQTEEADRYALARQLMSEVLREEARQNHRRTVIFGDFNMDPFEDGMQASDAFHAILSRREIEVRRGERTWQGNTYPMFFNPMWRSLGGAHPDDPPGSYYFKGSGGISTQYWHVFDQCLVRPDLMRGLPDNSVRILHEIAGQSLLNDNGRPDASRWSDHLPFIFKLQF